jgi:hypothetical protein
VTTVGGVPRSGEEIQAALTAFVARWKSYQGTERAEAQTYLNELFACYGTDRNAVGARLEDFTSSAGFMDLHWPQVCIIEMKRPSRAGPLSEGSLIEPMKSVLRQCACGAASHRVTPAATSAAP